MWCYDVYEDRYNHHQHYMVGKGMQKGFDRWIDEWMDGSTAKQQQKPFLPYIIIHDSRYVYSDNNNNNNFFL